MVAREALQKLQRFLLRADLTRHTNGKKLLKVLFFVHIIFLLGLSIIFSKEVHTFYTKCNQDESMCTTFWISIGTSIAALLTVSMCVVFLAASRKFKQYTREILKCYCVWNSIMIPIFLPGMIYMKIQLWNSRPNSTVLTNCIDVFIFIFATMSKLYLVFQVFRIHRKLESSVIDRWKEFRNKEEENAGAEEQARKLNPKKYYYLTWEDVSANKFSKDWDHDVEENHDHGQDVTIQDEGKKVTDEDFKSRIISPLSLTIDAKNSIGEGQFSTVYKGSLRQKRKEKVVVAAKVVKNHEDATTFQMLLMEIKIAILVGDHENVVQFYGISSDASMNVHFAIITEYCEQGCLEKFLKTNRHTFVDMLQQRGSIVFKNQQLYINLELHGTHTSMDLVRFASQIACGMKHLASKKIIHGDLAARNVLLTNNLTVKLADFGMSRKLYCYESYISGDSGANQCLPWRWMSHEALQDLKFSEKSDVYAYGVVMWEIFSLGSLPFEQINWTPDILKQIENGMRLERPAFASRDLYTLMTRCWNLDPRHRPKFREILDLMNDSKISKCCELNLMS